MNNQPMPWTWIAENYLGMDNPNELYQELDDQIAKEIMSKTMPNTPYWQKKSSTGNLEAQPWTAVLLKAKLNSSIKQFLIVKSIPKIDGYLFKEHILTLYDQTILNQFNITLNKNGKTVKVGKKTKSTISIKSFSFPAPSFGSKKSKVMIMEGKLKEVVNFHILRNHPTKYDFCLACRAIRAFVQYEFHQKQAPLKSGMTGTNKPVITPAEMNMIMLKKHDEIKADGAKFMKQQEILDEDADLFKLENEDFDGSN